jgi:hypothetical protein
MILDAAGTVIQPTYFILRMDLEHNQSEEVFAAGNDEVVPMRGTTSQAEADAAWEAAAALADNAVRGLEAQGTIPAVVIPNSDEALAKATLHEVALLALGPTNKRTKMQALNILLAFTKAKPAERRAISKANNPTDEWMQSVLQADKPAQQSRA